MAESEKASKRRQLKKTVTVRQQAERAGQPVKPRRVKRARSFLAIPFIGLWRVLTALLRPFSFLLWPFKTRIGRFIGRVLAAIFLLRYFRNSWRELMQVEWPNRRQTTKLTVAVFLFAIFFGVLISVVDYGLDKVFKQFILK
ncbi:MAG TPA: preprotein translocase subunit SecE [Patescibacteria group bacterium]|nr:preprotein translocase subunit SecE [Patescibacteria group bacterium]